MSKKTFYWFAFHAFAYITVVAAAISAVLLFEEAELDRLQAEQRADVNNIISELSRNLATALTGKTVAASGIAQTVSLLPEISQEEFSSISGRIAATDPSLVVTSLIRDLRITHVYPIESNENLLGADLSSSPSRVETINRVLDRGTGLVQGPIRLLIGVDGFVVRQPVVLRQSFESPLAAGTSTEYWGLVSLVFAAEPFFAEIGIAEIGPRYGVAIRDSLDPDQRTVFGDLGLFDMDPVLREVVFPLGAWEIAVCPSGGWASSLTNPWPVRGIASIVTIVLLMLLRDLLNLREANKRTARRLNVAIDTMPDGFVLFDENDRLVICNDKYKEFYPKSATAMTPGATFKSILEYGLAKGQYVEAKGREREWLAERLDQHRNDKAVVEQELDDGRWLRIIERTTPDGGRAGVRLDITELKRNEQALEERNKCLSEALNAREYAEARFSDLTEFSSEWFWEQDNLGRFTYFSDGFERATGIDPSTLIGKRRDEFRDADAETLSENGASDVIKAISARQPFQNFIYRAVDVRKNEMWVRTTGKPVFSKDGEFAGYRGVAADVTKLYQAVQEAKLAGDAKSHFLTVVSHELRTPLTVLLGYNAFVLNNEKLPSVVELKRAVEEKEDEDLSSKLETALSEIGTFSKKMGASGQQLKSIVSDLLDSTKMASGDFQMKFGSVGPKDDLASTLQHHQSLAEKKGLNFDSDIEDVPLYADLTRLQQILSNLLGNAIKFTTVGSVSIHGQIRDGKYRFEVSDTGIGMPFDVAKRAFEPFYQADPTESRDHQGIGLGLAITRRLVQLHGGEICVESAPNEGSQFAFTVPIYDFGLSKPQKDGPSGSTNVQNTPLGDAELG